MLTVVCIERIKDKNGITTDFKLQDVQGNVRDVSYAALKSVMLSKNITVVNLRLTSDNKIKYYDVDKKILSKELIMTDKLNQMRAFDTKQNLVGRIFDFTFNKKDGKIYISKYYDVPGRDVVIIPDFVDGLLPRHWDEDDWESDTPVGIFYKCKYVKKVIMHSNIQGKLTGLFTQFAGDILDLSDFNTSNVTDMTSMFERTYLDKVTFGNKFNTEKVKAMSYMFYCSNLDSLDLSSFNTHNVKDMEGMFAECVASSINFGDNFDTSNVKSMISMFDNSGFKELIFKDKFDTHNVETMQNMFCDCAATKIDLGHKFYTLKVSDTSGMFCNCHVNELYLGDNFDTTSVKNMQSMFDGTICNILDLGQMFYTHKADYMEDMFQDCEIHTLYIGDKFVINTGEKEDMFGDIKQIVFPKSTSKGIVNTIRSLIKTKIVINKQ